MARKKSPTLTDAELKIMDVLWERRAATVGDVVAVLSAERGWAYNTVLTFLRILEEKGYVRHTKQGRAHLYHPATERTDARRRALHHMVSRFFDGSPELLVQNLLEQESLTGDELTRIRELIDQTEGEES